MKAKVGDIFVSLQLAEGKRRKGIEESARTGKTSPDYARLLVIANILEDVLKNCQAEVELPPDTEDILVPFLSSHEMVSDDKMVIG